MTNFKLLAFFFFFVTTVHAQWVQLNTNTFLTIFSLSAVDTNVVWGCASGQNIFRTTNGGAVWQNVGISVPVNGVETSIFALDQNNALFATYEGFPVRTSYVFKTTDGGNNWIQVFSQSQNALITGIWMFNNSDGFMAGWPVGGRWSLWKTNNGGTSWDSTGMFIPETNPEVFSFENALFAAGTKIWFGARGKGIYHSSNQGNNWTLQSVGGGFVYPSAIWLDGNYGLSSGSLNIVKSTDGGNSWTGIPNTQGTEVLRGITGINNEWWHVREIDPNIYYSSDYGNTWNIQFTSPTGVGFRHITKSRTGNVLWASTIDGKIFKYIVDVVPVELTSFTASAYPGSVTLCWSTASETNNRGFEIQRNVSDNDNEWHTIAFKEGQGTTPVPINYSFTDYNITGNSQLKYRLKQIDFNGAYSFSSIQTVDSPPDNFFLSQNYPNPFNPSTKISCSVSESGFVSLKVFDVLGNEVAVLVNEYKNAGVYHFDFNASQLPSGIYIYKLESGGNIAVRKMSLLK